jgi:hypothetical protein
MGYKSSSKKTKDQRNKLRMRRRRLKLNKRKSDRSLSLFLKKNSDMKEVFDYSKWYSVGEEVLGDNYTSIVEKNYSHDKFNETSYGEVSKGYDIWTTESDVWKDGYRRLLCHLTQSLLDMTSFETYDGDHTELYRLSIEEPKLYKNERVGVYKQPSKFSKLSKRNRKRINEGLVKQFLNLENVIKQLDELIKSGGKKEFRTQSIDIDRTNIWSCFDDFSYGLLEWIWEERESLVKSLEKIVIVEVIKDIYMKLGHPNNRIERETNTIEKLFCWISEDETMSEVFRWRQCGWKPLSENQMIKWDIKFHKKRIDKWLSDNPLVKEIVDTNPSMYEHLTNTLSNCMDTQERYYNNTPSTLDKVKKKLGISKTKQYGIDWLTRCKDDDMISLYRSVSDKEFPEGWSWTMDKRMSVSWIKSRGLVEYENYTKSYLVEIRIPKKDIMYYHSIYSLSDKNKNKGHLYNEVIVTKEKLKGVKYNITEIDYKNSQSVKQLMYTDRKIKKSILHEEIVSLLQILKSTVVDELEEENPMRKHINDRWFIRKYWLDMSLFYTEHTFGNKKLDVLGGR